MKLASTLPTCRPRGGLMCGSFFLIVVTSISARGGCLFEMGPSFRALPTGPTRPPPRTRKAHLWPTALIPSLTSDCDIALTAIRLTRSCRSEGPPPYFKSEMGIGS
ncbi:hypothetical protein B0H13DRAFT_2111730 [Mycena leptocephala]|nr:hypothetical protein B0H13DRAFT_2111730 [Mycena leptocephala]